MRLALVTFLALATPAHAAATLFRGGTIWTGDPAHPRAEALLVDEGKIVAVGSNAEVAKAAAKASPRIVELDGRVVLPGLIDSHIHILGGGLQLARVDLVPARSRKETLAAIKKYAAEHPSLPWILGRGWSYDLWKPGFPTAAEPDAVLADRPVFVRAYDGHSGWANSKALAIADITAATPDPKDGHIVRVPGSKQPTGTLLEGAMDLVMDKLPKPTLAEKREAILRALAHAASHGLTALCEVGGALADLDVYEGLDKERALPLRVVYGPIIDDGIEKYAARKKTLVGTDHLYAGPLKGFVDGVVESSTATMLSAFSDGGAVEAAHIQPAQLLDQVSRADALDLDVAYHAVGDGAVRSVLDAVEASQKTHPRGDRRDRVEHIEVIAPADLPRFAKLHVVASVMPIHAEPSGELAGGVWSKKVGPERLRHAFAFGDLLRNNARLAFGSDWAVADLDPLPALAVAVTRTNAEGKPPGGWVGSQALTMDQALTAYTRGAAYATRLDAVTGVLSPGLAADLVVLDPSVKLDRPRTFFHGKVDSTWVGGKAVYERAR